MYKQAVANNAEAERIIAQLSKEPTHILTAKVVGRQATYQMCTRHVDQSRRNPLMVVQNPTKSPPET